MINLMVLVLRNINGIKQELLKKLFRGDVGELWAPVAQQS
jgi:hypothetical protein